VESAHKLGMDYYIPCHSGLECITHSIDGISWIPSNYTMNNISIIAGHFSWGIWNELPLFKEDYRNEDALEPTLVPSLANPPPCFLIGRHPVDRAISYYYQRCYIHRQCAEGYQRLLNSFDPSRIKSFVITNRLGGTHTEDPDAPVFILDEGFCEAGCRSVGDFKETTGRVVGVDDLSIPKPLSPAETRIALANAGKCVVGLQDRWEETLEVLKFWFPWIDLDLGDRQRRKMHYTEYRETMDTLRADIRQVIEQENRCDMLLYKQQTEQFENQLEVIKAFKKGL
jgi:hypothetical protein